MLLRRTLSVLYSTRSLSSRLLSTLPRSGSPGTRSTSRCDGDDDDDDDADDDDGDDTLSGGCPIARNA